MSKRINYPEYAELNMPCGQQDGEAILQATLESPGAETHKDTGTPYEGHGVCGSNPCSRTKQRPLQQKYGKFKETELTMTLVELRKCLAQGKFQSASGTVDLFFFGHRTYGQTFWMIIENGMYHPPCVLFDAIDGSFREFVEIRVVQDTTP